MNAGDLHAFPIDFSPKTCNMVTFYTYNVYKAQETTNIFTCLVSHKSAYCLALSNLPWLRNEISVS